MIRTTLQIRYSQLRQRDTVGWFVPGSNTAIWLEELCRWQVPLQQMVCRVIPGAQAEAGLRGVFVTLEGDTPRFFSRRCQQYGRIGERFYLPANALLHPPVLPTEIVEQLAVGDDDYVLHPSAGLLRFERDQQVRVAAMIAGPEPSDTDWSWAGPGEAMVHRLISVLPEHELSVEAILRDGAGDISTRSPFTGSLPSLPRSQASAGNNFFGRLARSMSAWFGKRISESGTGSAQAGRNWWSWIRKLSPNSVRLDRFLNLLEEDPDEALQFAIPLHGPEHRGRSSVFGWLFRRHVDFNLHQLGGGARGATWFVESDVFSQLIIRYRDLANREIALGRHRRAAYIFAHLLNDFRGAAATLADGEHFREAAIICRDRLKQPGIAARYFEQGGLWSEAIDMYRQLDDFEKIGALHRKLGQHDEATSAYWQAVDKRSAADDLIGAAKLLEAELNLPEKAIEYLNRGWPGSTQAEQCLSETIRILSDQNNHHECMKFLDRTHDRAADESSKVKAVRVFAHTATHYPDDDVRHRAADKVRVVASQCLPVATANAASELLKQVKRLAPQDRLLTRDCNRYRRNERGTRNKTVSSGRRSLLRKLKTLEQCQLPDEITWVAASGNEQSCYFAGHRNDRLVVARLMWKQLTREPDLVEWNVPHAYAGSPIHLCADLVAARRLHVHMQGSPEILGSKPFRRTDMARHEETAGGHAACSSNTHCLASSADGLTWIAEHHGHEILVNGYDRAAQFFGSRSLPVPPEFQSVTRAELRSLPFAVSRTHLYFGIHDCLVGNVRAGGSSLLGMGSRVLRIQTPLEDFPSHVMVTCDDGVRVVWHGEQEDRVELLNDGMACPTSGLTRNGDILCFDNASASLLTRRADHFEYADAHLPEMDGTFAILTGVEPDQLLVCGEAGLLQLLDVRRQ